MWKQIYIFFFKSGFVSWCVLPSSCAMLCLWLTEAPFHMASRTRLPNLEQAIWTYWPCGDRNEERLKRDVITAKEARLHHIEPIDKVTLHTLASHKQDSSIGEHDHNDLTAPVLQKVLLIDVHNLMDKKNASWCIFIETIVCIWVEISQRNML